MGKIMLYVFHVRPIQVLAKPEYFRPIVYISSIWKEVGFGTIIYLAAMAGVNLELYEAAIIDGANRLKQIWHITLPSIKSTIIILLILSMSTIMSAGFDQIFNLITPQVLNVGDVIDTYIYRHGIQGFEFSYSTAVELFKQAINLIMLFVFNYLSKAVGEDGVF
jgi:putative aldouronate transport system permease protein